MATMSNTIRTALIAGGGITGPTAGIRRRRTRRLIQLGAGRLPRR
jgi:hypothetical protein